MIMALSFIQDIFAELVIGLFDSVVYLLVAAAYYIFLQVSKLNLFGGSISTALELYDGFTSRIYTILSIIMIFVLAYQIILMIINPDSKMDKSTNLIKDVIITLIAIALCPTIFSYMALFQEHVIADGTITAIVLGSSGGNGENPGTNLSLIMLSSMFHPTGSGYATFVDSNGKMIKGTADYEGKTIASSVYTCIVNGSNETVCQQYHDSLEKYTKQKNRSVLMLTGNKVLKDSINEGMDYLWILCTAAGGVVIWMIASYTIDLGARAVKLGFLQLIAPIALIFKVIPSMKKNYDKWFHQLLKTYIDVFLKLFVISFVIQICLLVPDFVEILFNSTNAINGGLYKGIAIVCLIIGLLVFAKEAPTLLKDLFGGNDLFSGINFKPGIKDRVEPLSKPIAFGAQTIAGGVGNARRALNDDKKGDAIPGVRGVLHRVGRGATSFARGAVTGAKEGAKSDYSLSKDGLVAGTLNQIKSGAKAGSAEGKRHEQEFNRFKDQHKTSGFVSALATSSAGKGVRDHFSTIINSADSLGKSWNGEIKEGSSGLDKSAASAIEGISNIVNQITVNGLDKQQYDNMVEAYEEALREFYQNNSANYGGQTLSSVQDIENKFKETLEAAKDGVYNGANGDALVRHQQNMAEQIAKIIRDNRDNLGTELIRQLNGGDETKSLDDFLNELDTDIKNLNATNAAANEQNLQNIAQTLSEGLRMQQEMDSARSVGRQNNTNNNQNNPQGS